MPAYLWKEYEQGSNLEYNSETNRWYYVDDYYEDSSLWELTPVYVISYEKGETIDSAVTTEVVVTGNGYSSNSLNTISSSDDYFVDGFYSGLGGIDTGLNSNTPETDITSPENTAQTTVSTASSQLKSAFETVQVSLIEETGNLKNSAFTTLQLADSMTEGVIMFEEGYMPEEYARYYANNLDDLKKTIDGIQAEGMKLYNQYGDTVGKAYAAGMLAKVIGGVGTTVDWIELGNRISTAADSGNWDAVYGQAAKMVTTFTAGLGVVGIARAAALGITGLAGGGAVVTAAITLVGAGFLTFVISESADYIESQISQGKLSEFLQDKTSDEIDEIAVAGNIEYTGDTLLEADEVTLIGNHHFENLEVNSQELTIIGNIQSDNRMVINSEKTETINTDEIIGLTNTKSSSDFAIDNPVPEENTEKNDMASTTENTNLNENTNNVTGPTGESQEFQQYLQELDELFRNNHFDFTVHMRAMDNAATIQDLEYLAAYETWLEYRSNYTTVGISTNNEETSSTNLIQ